MSSRAFAFAALLLGCSRPGAAPPAEDVDRARSWSADVEVPEPAAPRSPERGHRGGRAVTAVAVDGRLVGVLRHAELPPQLPTLWQTLDDGQRARRYGWASYLKAVGVDVSAMVELRLVGGRDRVCRIPGAEVRRLGDRLRFSFTKGDRGKPRVEYPDEPVAMSTSIDKIQRVEIVSRATPPMDAPHTARTAHGTRVYLDGRLLGVATASELEDEGVDTVEALLATFGVRLDDVRLAELVGADERPVALPVEALGSAAVAPSGGQDGGLRIGGVPAEGGGAADEEAVADAQERRAHALMLYARHRPADRRAPPNTLAAAHAPQIPPAAPRAVLATRGEGPHDTNLR